jgi:hypothetical protein
MAGKEHTPDYFVSTVLVDHPRLGRGIRMNAAAYDPERDGVIIEGPTLPSARGWGE